MLAMIISLAMAIVHVCMMVSASAFYQHFFNVKKVLCGHKVQKHENKAGLKIFFNSFHIMIHHTILEC